MTIAFCLATCPLLLERTDTEKFGLRRISEDELTFPEEHYNLLSKSAIEEEGADLVLDVVEEGDEEAGSKTEEEKQIASENTPLLL